MSVLNYKTDSNIAVIEINSPPVNALGIDVRRGLIEGAHKAWDDASIYAIAVSYTHLTLPTILLV